MFTTTHTTQRPAKFKSFGEAFASHLPDDRPGDGQIEGGGAIGGRDTHFPIEQENPRCPPAHDMLGLPLSAGFDIPGSGTMLPGGGDDGSRLNPAAISAPRAASAHFWKADAEQYNLRYIERHKGLRAWMGIGDGDGFAPTRRSQYRNRDPAFCIARRMQRR